MSMITRTFTTTEACKLDISDVLKYPNGGVIQWESGHMVYVERLKTCVLIQSLKTGVKQYVTIDCVPSNLGTGEIPYFICPLAEVRCKILFRDMITGLFAGREALKGKMYYPLQICTRTQRANVRYFGIKREINKLEQKRRAHCYNGRITKRWVQGIKKKQQLIEANEQRTIALGAMFGQRFGIG